MKKLFCLLLCLTVLGAFLPTVRAEGNPNEFAQINAQFAPTGRITPERSVVRTEITFQNVIVQLIKMDWWNKSVPYPEAIGTGNADYFIGGRHMAGVWQRTSVADRTVFYDENGDELELQRGRTLIIVMDYQTDHHSVRYE